MGKKLVPSSWWKDLATYLKFCESVGLTIDVANKKKYPLPSLTPLLRVDTTDELSEIKTLDKNEVIIAGKASNSLENEFISRIGTETNLKPKDKIEIVIEVL